MLYVLVLLQHVVLDVLWLRTQPVLYGVPAAGQALAAARAIPRQATAHRLLSLYNTSHCAMQSLPTRIEHKVWCRARRNQ
jgi:hypothetical protein